MSYFVLILVLKSGNRVPRKTNKLLQSQNLFEKRREAYVAKLVIQYYQLCDWLKVFLSGHFTGPFYREVISYHFTDMVFLNGFITRISTLNV